MVERGVEARVGVRVKVGAEVAVVRVEAEVVRVEA